MSYKIVFFLSAIVVAAFGLALLIVPTTILDQFRMDKVATVVYMARVLGAALASLGFVLWFAKDAVGAEKNLGMAALAGCVLGIIVTIMGLASGVIRTNGWIPLVVEVVLGLGFAFMIFLQPRMK